MNSQQLTISQFDWEAAKLLLHGDLSADDIRIVDMLAPGVSTSDIAKALGTNRSAVWRRAQKIKTRIEHLRRPEGDQ